MPDTRKQQPQDFSQNQEKDTDQWVTGEEPMTGPQRSYLETLLQQAGRSADELDESMTKARASESIDRLQEETGRGQDGS